MTNAFDMQKQTVLLEPGGLSVPVGSRVAYMYEGERERVRFAHFIACGLVEGDKCVIITDRQGRDLFLSALGSRELDLSMREQDGSLAFILADMPNASMEELILPLLEDARERFRFLRCINDIGWMSKVGWSPKEFMRLELKGHLLAQDYTCLVICQYDVEAIERRYINQLITSHQFTVVSSSVERDPTRRPQGQVIFDSMGDQLRSLKRLQDLSLKLTASRGLDEILDVIIEAAMAICSAEMAVINYFNCAGELTLMRHRGLSREYLNERHVTCLDPTIAQAFATRRPVIVGDVDELEGISSNYKALKREGVASVVSLPLISEGKVFGVISAGATAPRYYTPTDTDAMSILAAQASAAIVNSRLFQQLHAANRAKDEFLATLSHELRTPLTPILGWAHMLKRFSGVDPLLAQGLATVERNTSQLAVLINDLLDLTRVISGKIELIRETSDLGELVRASVDLVRPQSEARAINLEVTVPAEPLICNVDPVRIQQVLANLLNNAVKFTHEGGRVRVSLVNEPATDEAVIEVVDSGIGIEPEFLPHVFERFTQGHGGINRRYGGLGLGLAITRAIVEMHGGSISASSKGLGYGSRFTVRLPRLNDLVPPAWQQDAESPFEAGKVKVLSLKVLVIEDSRDTLDMLEMWLKSWGCEVRSAVTAFEGIKLAMESTPDLIISDIGLPEIDGYELIRRLRRMPGCERIPAIALTGYAREDDRDLALAAGYDAHLAKPTEMRFLLYLIKQLANR